MPSLTPEQVDALAQKRLVGTLSPAEEELLHAWIRQASPAELEWRSSDPTEDALKQRLLATIRASAGLNSPVMPAHRVHFLRRFRWAAAAVFLLVCMGTWWIVADRKERDQPATGLAVAADKPAPVVNRATLTIDGKAPLVVGDLPSGSLASKGISGVTKAADGSLVYDAAASEIQYHTYSNPKFSPAARIELPDHSVVWLNASSSIRYPNRFTGKDRMVELSGEGYFEVKHNAAQPFKVKAGEQLIEDIGTAFNVNAYPEETGVRTTLVEGVVKISERAVVKTLQPGEAFMNGKVTEADTDQAIAWKNGLFSFGNTVDLQTALRQLGRWYDVEIVYEGKIPNREFGGKIQRSLSLARVLEILSEQKVHARIEGNKLIVQP